MVDASRDPNDACAPDLEQHPVVFFDGQCNLCNGVVDFVIRKDRARVFRFASLQSEAAARMLPSSLPAKTSLNSFVLLEHDRITTRSTATLRLVRRLPFPYPWLYPFVILPRFIRDPIYRFIARNRYRMFGKSDTCRVPSEEERALFLG